MWSFAGRTRELARLIDSATKPAGHGLLIAGDPGIGRSRLLHEGVRQLATDQLYVWTATGSSATAELPLGTLSPALREEPPPGLPAAGLLRWAANTIRGHAAGRPVILAVDDAHLLDPLSATLLQHLAHTDGATILGTVRTGQPLPEAVRGLWADGLVDRMELTPLTESAIGDLLAAVLGGPVDAGSVRGLRQLSEGRPLLLRELVLAAQAAGDLTEAYGLWHWTGQPRLAPTLVEILDCWTGELSPPVREVVEVVAFSEPVGLALLTRAADPTAVEAAEERHLIRVVREGRRTMVALNRPLHGELLRQRCPSIRARRLRGTLADLTEEYGARRGDDLLRVARWRLDSDAADDPRLLLAACRQALRRHQLELAGRFARAAVTVGGGIEASTVLALIFGLTGQPAAGRAVLDAVSGEVGPGPERSRWSAARGVVSCWGPGDSDRTDDDTLAAAAASLTDPTDLGRVDATRASIHLFRGEPDLAVRFAHAVTDQPTTAPESRALAMVTLTHVAALRGEPVSALRQLRGVDLIADRCQGDVPQLRLELELARGCAALLSGEPAHTDCGPYTGIEQLTDSGGYAMVGAYLAISRCQAARLRGRLARAGQHADHACARLAAGGAFAALAHAERAHVAALSGQPAVASAAMAESDQLHRGNFEIVYPWRELARCWTLASGGDVCAAAEVLDRLVDRLDRDGFTTHQVYALHDRIRLGTPGDPVLGRIADRLTGLTSSVDSSLPPVLARHARAVADRDGHALLGAADALAGHGLILHAAEAAATAVNVLRADRSPHAREAAERLVDLQAACPGAGTPALTVAQPTLTVRERQIARLAAAGVTSKEIAERLYLSTRTVDNHLLRVYGKLGVTGRSELPAALRAGNP